MQEIVICTVRSIWRIVENDYIIFYYDKFSWIDEAVRLKDILLWILWQELSEKLKVAGQVDSSDELLDIHAQLSRLAEETEAKTSAKDIETLLGLYRQWADDRQTEVDIQLEQHRIEQKKKDLVQRILDLQAREEKLRYFEKQTQIELKISERPPDPQIEEAVSEEEFVAPPGERKTEKRRK